VGLKMVASILNVVVFLRHLDQVKKKPFLRDIQMTHHERQCSSYQMY